MKCPRCDKAATVEQEMFCSHPTCPLPLPGGKCVTCGWPKENHNDGAAYAGWSPCRQFKSPTNT